MHKHNIIFTLRLDQESWGELDQLSSGWRCSRAEALRRMIQNSYAHIFKKEPRCADGSSCPMPQFHTKKTGV